MKNFKTLCLVLATVAIVSVQAVPTQISPGGNWYDVVQAPGIDWDNANAAANASFFTGFRGHLVTITGSAEDAFVLGLVSAAYPATARQPSEFWAGGYQNPVTTTDPQANWTWVNGEGAFPGVNGGLGYSNWANGEPNDASGPGSEQYLGLGLLDFINPTTWNDEGSLGLIAGYVVEYERTSVPEGGVGVVGLLTVLGLIAARRSHKSS
jgi:hypothetical protein